MSYSQHNEEPIILDYFTGIRGGRFLDVGAYCSKFSNTLALAELGWSGVCVEPSPAACAELLKLHGNNERISVVNVAVLNEPGWNIFHDSGGDGVSTFSATHRAKWADRVDFRPLCVWAVTPAQLLNRVGYSFDFISLDIEGLNWPVLQQIPLTNVRMICVEHDGYQQQVVDYCAAAGLGRVLLRNAENLICAK